MIGRTNATIGGKTQETQLVNYTMLYDSGNECEDVTGGYNTVKSYTSATLCVVKNNNSIEFTSVNPVNQSGVCTANKIDLTKYSKMGIYAEITNVNNTSYQYDILTYLSQTIPTSSTNGLSYSGKYLSSHKTDIGSSTVPLSLQFIDVSESTIDNAYVMMSAYGCTGSIYNAFLIKEDNWQEWISKAELTGYSTLEAVLADSTTLETLMNNKKAVEYMIYNCTGTVMASVIQSESALEVIRNSQYNAQIYANEHWNKFLRMVGEVPESEKTYLYNLGDECTDLTGGWTFPSAVYTTQQTVNGTAITPFDYNYNSLGTLTRTKNTDNIYLYASVPSYSAGGGSVVGTCFTTNSIDLTSYTKLVIEGEFTSNVTDTNGAAAFRIYNSKPNGEVNAWSSIASIKPVGILTVTLDISEITGDKWISAMVNCYSGNNSTASKTVSSKVYKIWLE